MDTFPNEFLAQHRPLVFVAGISPPLPPLPPKESPASLQPLAAEQIPSLPPQRHAPEDAFEVLTANLRSALAPKRIFPVWDNAQQPSPNFHVVLVDKNIPFPPRKARPPPGGPAHPLHSPLSPLTPSSPLYPDGVLAPIWIRKHRELQPSIFILVERLYEPPSLAHPLGNGPVERPQAEVEAERRYDHALAQAVVERKRTTSERGIKLAVIILTSRRMLDDPSLDVRLSALRRAAGLDSRSSLFVLSPLPLPEVNRFVASLKSELHESALDYYREHSRRVRRKRGRPSVTATSSAYVAQQSGSPGHIPLSQSGWHVRADYKLATFAEFRAEDEAALKHYEDAWEGLCTMFANTAVLPPRTKRWAEAKVLVDCINMKICKLYLYQNEPSRALARFHQHAARFHDFCNGWGIGDETFEFWSWLSKQYRLLGDLVDLACRNGFRLTVTLPPSPASLPTTLPTGQTAAAAAATFGLATKNILQHAGYYYFESAACAEERRDRFRSAEQDEEEMRARIGDTFTGSPALMHEKKVNHADIIIELYTKAYEIFKKFNSNRMTLFIASCIADAHHKAGDHGMALRFYERIARSHRREGSPPALAAVLLQAYRSAGKARATPAATALAYEVLARGQDSEISADEKQRLADELPKLLQAAVPSNAEASRIDVDLSEAPPLLQTALAFWTGSTNVGEAVQFQLSIALPSHLPPQTTLSFDTLELAFTDGCTVLIEHSVQSMAASQRLRCIDLGTLTDNISVSIPADLSWSSGNIVVFKGSFICQKTGILGLNRLKLQTTVNGWTVEVISSTRLPEPGGPALSWLKEASDDAALIPLEGLASTCQISARQPKLDVELRHEDAALIDEFLPLHLRLLNNDSMPLDVHLSASFLNTKGESATTAEDSFVVDAAALPEPSIDNHALGSLEPTAFLECTILIRLTAVDRERRIQLLLTCIPKVDDATAAGIAAPAQIARNVTLPVSLPFTCDFSSQYLRRAQPSRTPLAFGDHTGWEGARLATVMATINSTSNTDLWLERVEVDCQSSSRPARLVNSSLAADGTCHSHLLAGSAFAVACQLEIADSDGDAVPNLIVYWSRSPRQENTPSSCSVIPFESMYPPEEHLVVTSRIPTHTYLHQRTAFRFHISNPTIRVMDLSFQLESSDQWLFSGPRKIGRILLFPDASRELSMQAVPINVGELDIPRPRVFERLRLAGSLLEDSVGDEDVPSQQEEGSNEPPPLLGLQTRELEVVRETEVMDPTAKGSTETTSTLSVIVLPPRSLQ